MFKPFALASICGLTVLGAAAAQGVNTADVNIVSVEGAVVKGGFVCTAVINNQNDDDSYDTRVIVLLPLQVANITRMSVSGGPGSCTKGPLRHGFREFAICNLGHLPQGPTVRRTVQVTTTPSTVAPHYPYTCSAFIFSQVGDIQKNNNYKWSTPVP